MKRILKKGLQKTVVNKVFIATLFLSSLVFLLSCDRNQNIEDDNLKKTLLIEKSLALDVTKNLIGSWWIDTLEIEINYSHPYFRSDTTLIKFGEINFNSWQPVKPGSDSYSYMCNVILWHDRKYYPIRFEYLMASANLKEPDKSKLYSFIYPDAFPEGMTAQTNPFDLQNYSILDNVEIIKINDREYYLRGLNRGMKKMKLRKM